MSFTAKSVINLDVVKPETYWIYDRFGARCYRRNVRIFSSTEGTDKIESAGHIVPVVDGIKELSIPNRIATCRASYDGDEPPCGMVEEEKEVEYEIIYNDKFNSFSTRIAIAKEYHKHIIGKQGETRKRLENQTRTRIDVPKIGHDGDIVITSSCRSSVASCRRRIEMLVDSARQRQPFTHFISLPFNSEEIVQNFNKFKRQVLKECKETRGVDESIFISPERLHLTIGMLVLLSNDERTLAKETLEQCKTDVIIPHLSNLTPPLSVRLKGLNYMNDDPSEVNVLYGNVEPMNGLDMNILQSLANKIVDYFVDKNVMPRQQYDTVKLHVTLMNTRYRTNNDEFGDGDVNGQNDYEQNKTGGFYDYNRNGQKYEKPQSFDARTIFEKFRDFNFGVQQLKELHISQRHVRRDGYYPCTSKIDIC